MKNKIRLLQPLFQIQMVWIVVAYAVNQFEAASEAKYGQVDQLIG